MDQMADLLGLELSLGGSVIVFAVAGALAVVCTTRLVALGDALADRTGWGEAIFGAVFFGLATSLSGIVMTATTAASGEPSLAYSNAIGGIAAQTLVIADVMHPRGNLEHAAASLSNMLFGCLLILLLTLALMGSLSPEMIVLGMHPASLVMVAVYGGGLWLIRKQPEPMWRAVRTTETYPDVPTEHGRLTRRGSAGLWAEFLSIAAIVVAGGWAVAEAAQRVVVLTGLSSSFTGAVLMGLINALPEIVAAVAAVQRGAVTLAVATIVGGNCLDVLNLALGDLVYGGSSLYHAVGRQELFTTGSALLMVTILLGGLLLRQRRGWMKIGFDGVLILVVYIVTVGVLMT